MYENGRLSKVSACQFPVMIPSKLGVYSLLLSNSRYIKPCFSELMNWLTGFSSGILTA